MPSQVNARAGRSATCPASAGTRCRRAGRRRARGGRARPACRGGRRSRRRPCSRRPRGRPRRSRTTRRPRWRPRRPVTRSRFSSNTRSWRDVDDRVQRAVGVHDGALEKQPLVVAGLDQQEADRAVLELRLVPDVQALAAGHRAHAARAVALAVPALDLLRRRRRSSACRRRARLEQMVELGRVLDPDLAEPRGRARLPGQVELQARRVRAERTCQSASARRPRQENGPATCRRSRSARWRSARCAARSR